MEKEFHVRNVSEMLVDEYIDDCIKSSGMCTCAKCRADVKAYALNNFPPHYVVTEVGELITQARTMSLQFRTDIITAIMLGIVTVSANPKH